MWTSVVLLGFACIVALCTASYPTTLVESSGAPSSLQWNCICSSSDGVYLAATALTNPIYVSSDFGSTWTNTSSTSARWYGIASSANGSQLIAVSGNVGTYKSANFGLTWTKVNTDSGNTVASSGTGQYVYMAGAKFFYSHNFGQTWTQSENYQSYAISCSANGQYVLLTVYDGDVYLSTNYGVTFTDVYNVSATWSAGKTCGNGQYMAVGNNDYVYVSSNYGMTWTVTDLPNKQWSGIAMSYNGSFMIAVSNTDYYYSTNYGVAWTTVAMSNNWASVTSSYDGFNLAAVVSNGGIYTNVYVPSAVPTQLPTALPTTSRGPTVLPTFKPTNVPTIKPSLRPSSGPTLHYPTSAPSSIPTVAALYTYDMVEMYNPSLFLGDVASTGSGQILYATALGFGIFGSSNFGNSFNALLDDNNSWSGVACSNNGQFVYAIADEVYASNDFGDEWNELPVSSGSDWTSIATDSSGQFVYTSGTVGGRFTVFASNDFGANWNSTTIGSLVRDLDCSSDGQFVTAVTNASSIYWSNNFGATFHKAYNTHYYWNSVAVASSGQHQVAGSSFFGSHPGEVYQSTNYGLNWTQVNLPNLGANTVAVSISSTGQYMFAATSGGSLYWSDMYGEVWESTMNLPVSWMGLTVSWDGQNLVGVAGVDGVYTNQYNVPSSMPSNVPSDQPSSVPSCRPSDQPSSQPTLRPTTSFPSSQPSTVPSSCPTLQPSSYPTFDSTFAVSADVLSIYPNSTYTFDNIGCGADVFISASLLVSYLDASSAGFVDIIATNKHGRIVSVAQNCAPVDLCGSVVCAVNVNITSVIGCGSGGSVTLYSTTVNAAQQSGVDTLCTYHGTPGLQYAISYTISANPLPTSAPTAAPTPVVPPDFVFNASPNTPFYVIATIALLFTGLGVFLVRLKDMDGGEFAEMKLTSTCYDLALIGYHLASELFYIIVFV